MSIGKSGIIKFNSELLRFLSVRPKSYNLHSIPDIERYMPQHTRTVPQDSVCGNAHGVPWDGFAPKEPNLSAQFLIFVRIYVNVTSCHCNVDIPNSADQFYRKPTEISKKLLVVPKKASKEVPIVSRSSRGTMTNLVDR